MRYSIRAQRGHSPLSFTGSDCRPGNGPEIALFEYLQPEMPIATGVLNLYVPVVLQMHTYKGTISSGTFNPNVSHLPVMNFMCPLLSSMSH